MGPAPYAPNRDLTTIKTVKLGTIVNHGARAGKGRAATFMHPLLRHSPTLRANLKAM
jgi:hypothetical protein